MSDQEEYQLSLVVDGYNAEPWAVEMYIYYIFAKEFGWTPEEVRKLKRKEVLSLLYILKQYYDRMESEAKWQTGETQTV